MASSPVRRPRFAQIAVFSTVLIAVAPGAASASADAGLSFIKWTDGNSYATVWVADADGSNQRELPGTSGAGNTSLSPDGTKVAFDVRGSSVWVINSDGTDLHWIAPGAMPQWSPDGKQVVYSAGSVGSYSIAIVPADGGQSRTVAAWGGVQSYPTWSPDGKDIAFVTNHLPDRSVIGGAYAQDWAIYRTSVDGSNPREVIGPGRSDFTGPLTPAYSPAGSKIVFMAYELVPDYWGQLYTVNADGSDVRQITDQTGNHIHPTWSVDSSTVASTVDANQGCPEIWTFASGGGGGQKLIDGCSAYPSYRKVGNLALASDADLLDKYTPILRYDAQETYRADSVAEITDNYQKGRGRGNLLKRGQTILAAADPSSPYRDLSLGLLGYPLYADRSAALPDDYIDEANAYATDAQRLHALPQYADRAYGHVVHTADGNTILQYWFFYYYNSKTYFTRGAHEGDWEMIQVELNSEQTPIQATYSQHKYGERCAWSHVQRVATNPIVYVAEGSHANYFSSGFHFNDGAADTASGTGDSAIPQVLNVTSSTDWVDWPGRWGGTPDAFAGAASPQGPKFHDAWSDPVGWSASGDACTESQTFTTTSLSPRVNAGGAARVRPPAPTVTARRHGSKVLVTYRFRSSTASGVRKPSSMLISVKSAERRYTPLTSLLSVSRSRGRLLQPVGRGHGPFHVLVSVLTRRGLRSRTVSVPVTGR